MFKKIFIFLLIFIILIAALNYKRILKGVFPKKYEDSVKKYASMYKLDPHLVYSIILAESGFNKNAVSKKGAIGLMQITPQTGSYISSLLKRKDFNQNMLYDPEVNIEYGCYYLSKLIKDFNGETEYAIAAYNGGEGNLRKWIADMNSKKKKFDINSIPFKETKQYVKRVNKYNKFYELIYGSSKNK